MFKIYVFLKVQIINTEYINEIDNIDIFSREKLTTIIKRNSSKLKFFKFFNKFIDNENSINLTNKFLYHYGDLFEIYKTINIVKKKESKKNLIFFTFFKNDLSRITKAKYLFDYNFFIKLIDFFFKITFILKLFIKYKKTIKKSFKNKFSLASEISNFKYLNQKIGEPNYLDITNTIYYITEKKNLDIQSKNTKYLRKNINYIDLRYLKPNNEFFQEFKKNILNFENFMSYNVKLFEIFFSQYNCYENLFKNIGKIKYHLIIESSNDLRLINLETSIAKYISNKNKSKLIGYQTRSPYVNECLSYYSYYDLYFAWSKFWFDKKNVYADKLIYGSPYSNKFNFNNINKNITFFPQEINNSIHCSNFYFLKFFNIALEVAYNFDDYKIFFKMKYPGQFNPNFKNYIIPKNFIFYDNFSDNELLIQRSSLVISQGYTSPGFYALGLGIKSIYLSHLNINNKSLMKLPIVYGYDSKKLRNVINNLLDKKHHNKIFVKTRKKIFSPNFPLNEIIKSLIVN
ncbi:hypothetical protein N9440_04255 [Alphaproteobacteria bacterium]|nr:hypothetical protein [Alphaproteobacteria bacterium]